MIYDRMSHTIPNSELSIMDGSRTALEVKFTEPGLLTYTRYGSPYFTGQIAQNPETGSWDKASVWDGNAKDYIKYDDAPQDLKDLMVQLQSELEGDPARAFAAGVSGAKARLAADHLSMVELLKVNHGNKEANDAKITEIAERFGIDKDEVEPDPGLYRFKDIRLTSCGAVEFTIESGGDIHFKSIAGLVNARNRHDNVSTSWNGEWSHRTAKSHTPFPQNEEVAEEVLQFVLANHMDKLVASGRSAIGNLKHDNQMIDKAIDAHMQIVLPLLATRQAEIGAMVPPEPTSAPAPR